MGACTPSDGKQGFHVRSIHTKRKSGAFLPGRVVAVEDRVSLKGIPAIVGDVVELRGGQAHVYWSRHTHTWTDVGRLVVRSRAAHKTAREANGRVSSRWRR